jgi:ParB family transcriptional regulator, chromosome partitioning protein
VKASATAKNTKPGGKPRPASTDPVTVQLVPIEDIDPSPVNRGARNIDELVASVREHGIQQPIKVRPKGSRFEIVYGERRYRAAKQVGLKQLPATVEDLTDEQAHVLRIVENACRLLRARSKRHYPDCGIIPRQRWCPDVWRFGRAADAG